MRKHSARKWLHFILDLLPILVLPVFAIYEINHDNNEFITVTDGAWEHRALYQTNEVESESDIVVGNIYHFTFDDASIDAYFGSFTELYINVIHVDDYNFQNQDDLSLVDYINFVEYPGTPSVCAYFTGFDLYFDVFLNFNLGSDYLCQVSIGSIANDIFTFNFDGVVMTASNIDDVSFISPSTYQVYEYIYNENHVYDNTDIGSQMMYALYKPVKDYFNFNNVFNFGDIYHWFELNMFNGNAPMPIFIVWNIIVYQFLMDLMFLVYSIFMFIIDFTSECLERCFSFSRHGGSR